MTEKLDLAHLSISDRVQREEMNDDRDAALSASATLTNESQDPTVRHVDHFKQLPDQVDPPISILLSEGDTSPSRQQRVAGDGAARDLNQYAQVVPEQAKALYRYRPDVEGRLFEQEA